jgi:peptidoglycan/LPS O-acetylase OafA/YrhL
LHWLPKIFVAMAVACFGLRVLAEPHFQAEFSDVRCDGLFAGVALGYFYHYHRERFLSWSRWPLLAVGILFLLPVAFMAQSSALRASFTMSTNMIAFSLILLWAVTRELPYTKLIAEIGKYSYSIYLWHHFIARVWGSPLEVSTLKFCGYVLSSIVMGILSTLLVEIPILRIRERFFPRSGGPLVVEHQLIEDVERSPGDSLRETANEAAAAT